MLVIIKTNFPTLFKKLQNMGYSYMQIQAEYNDHNKNTKFSAGKI